jgi:predicted secreted protein
MITTYLKFRPISLLIAGILLLHLNANSQEWTVWDCSTIPEVAGFSVGDNDPQGATNFSVVIDDPDIAGNKLWKFDMYADGNPVANTTYNMEWNVASTTKSTMVARIKGIDGSLSDKVAEIDIRSVSYGSKLQIYYYDSLFLAYVEEAAVEIPNLSDWHIYRVTMDGETFTAYLDEDPVAVLSGATSKQRSDNWFKIGDGSDGTTISGIFDWLIWDASGAYAPGQGADIPEELYLGLESDITNDYADNLKVYPVPVEDYVFIDFPFKVVNSDLKVISILGETVLNIKVNKQKIKLDLSELNAGIYFLKMDHNNNTYIKQLIVK